MLGSSRSPEYVCWCDLKARCLNENTSNFKDYGGRGIGIDSRWVNDFRAFLNHVGKRPSSKHSIERIDNMKGYVPGNVRWATKKEQQRNTRKNVRVTFRGETRSLIEWCELLGLEYSTIRQRIKNYGWTAEEALSTPIRKRR